ncbi:hypothetical protein BaRGS_00020925 [Batillaria attramentaria]|uniref:Major facilitator superfamily (MFS) profile domain-containing protein n=1 Tax=Batillaria attramentaria TaxID=370345 RepID=A0ABD0KLJ8_9CAEN
MFAEKSELSDLPLFPSYRLGIVLITLAGVFCNFATQSSTGASLLTMLQQKNNFTSSNATDDGAAPTSAVNGTRSPHMQWRFSWDKKTQGWILSSFFIGYYAMQFLVGWLANRFGGKRVCMVGAVTLACLQGVIVVAAADDPTFFIIVIAVAGFVNGSIMASIMGIAAKWIPPQENSRLSSLTFSGCLLLVTAILICVFVTDSPDTNTRVSPQERKYIQDSFSSHGYVTVSMTAKVPWLKIITSLPVLAVASAQFGSDWLMYCIITVIPSYFKYVRHMDTFKVDVLTGVPLAGMPLVGILASVVVDRLRKKDTIATTTVRKFCLVFAQPIPGLLLLLMSFLPDDNEAGVIVLYTVAVLMLTGLSGCSWVANIVEMCPEYTSIIGSFAQIVAMTSSFIAPLVLTALTPNNTAEEWRVCFGVIFAVVVTSFAIFTAFGSSAPQNWHSSEIEILVIKPKTETSLKANGTVGMYRRLE